MATKKTTSKTNSIRKSNSVKNKKMILKNNFERNFTIKKIIFTIISTLFVLFIFSNSLQNGVSSSSASSGVLNWIQNFNLGINITEHFIRKTGHFCEFFAFGILMTSTIYVYTNDIIENIFAALFFGLLVPVCDETIQMFSNGRSALVSDILLDFSGVVTGLIAVSLFIFIKKKKS